MCGIAGIIDLDGRPVARQELEPLASQLRHRGGDGEGFSTLGPVAFWHTRLSQLDPSFKSAQPMESSSGNSLLVFNGFVSNFRKLRPDSMPPEDRIPSGDTAIVLAQLQQHGSRILDEFDGMFSLAWYDRMHEQVILARDSGGIKPLYYTRTRNRLIFASEAAAIVRAGFVSPSLDRETFPWYLEFQGYPPGRTLFQDVLEIPPGSVVTISLRGEGIHHTSSRIATCEEEMSRSEAIELLRQAVSESVANFCCSDHDPAVMLSGGLDSSIVSLLAQRHQSRTGGQPVTAYSSLFDDYQHKDESEYIEAVVCGSGIRAVPVHLADDELRMAHSELGRACDYPVCGPAAPLLALARRIGATHRVCLSGLGGDELFAGYPKIIAAAKSLHLSNGSTAGWDLGFEQQTARIQDSAGKGAEKILQTLFSRCGDLTSQRRKTLISDHPAWNPGSELVKLAGGKVESIKDLLRIDQQLLLPGLLQLDDRLGLCSGVECRPPLLSRGVRQLAATIPARYFLTGGLKSLLRDAFADLLPPLIRNRRDKSGIIHPVSFHYQTHWKSVLQPWFDVVDDARLFNQSTAELIRKYENPLTCRLSWVLYALGSWLTVNSIRT